MKIYIFKESMEPLRPSLFPNVPPFINYIPTPDGKKIFPPARLREQLWRIPQGVINVLDMQNSVQKKKQDKEEDIEEIIDMVFPDNVVTIGNFKNNHFGCPLTQANLQDNINLLQTKNF